MKTFEKMIKTVERLRLDIAAMTDDIERMHVYAGVLDRQELTYYLSQEILDEVLRVLDTQSKIHAIKYMRYAFAPNMILGLKESKRIVEAIVEGQENGVDGLEISHTGYCIINIRKY